MARHTLTRVLPYAPERLFEMVRDVRRYPEFLPWVTAMRVWNERAESDDVSTIDAEAQVGFSFLRERFSTRVRGDAKDRKIDVTLISGPFRNLAAHWRFDPHPVGALVRFEIDFEFRSRLLDTMLAANLPRAVNRLIACFETRAMALYPALTPASGAQETPATQCLAARG